MSVSGIRRPKIASLSLYQRVMCCLIMILARWLTLLRYQKDLLTLNIPLASQQTVFTFFEAKLIPMPFPDDSQTALIWTIEAPYLAPSENKLGSSVLSVKHFSTVSVRRSTEFALKHSNRDWTPFLYCNIVFFSPIDAFAVCAPTAVTSPSFEQATDHGFGTWPITSANVLISPSANHHH